ncbi:hypothetical protein DSO57_1029767 [Entomophthora muscae]|uniref:Uncharacterized protein n=1 Tax=Entomophthora muscae TaxID=34485 RepID=A0ACC2S2Z7_9FUNG|nr:hypothetical protein DSO57_1029767 [Entomophthora muscae]
MKDENNSIEVPIITPKDWCLELPDRGKEIPAIGLMNLRPTLVANQNLPPRKLLTYKLSLVMMLNVKSPPPPLALDRTIFPQRTKKSAWIQAKPLNSLGDLAHTIDKQFVLAYPSQLDIPGRAQDILVTSENVVGSLTCNDLEFSSLKPAPSMSPSLAPPMSLSSEEPVAQFQEEGLSIQESAHKRAP